MRVSVRIYFRGGRIFISISYTRIKVIRPRLGREWAAGGCGGIISILNMTQIVQYLLLCYSGVRVEAPGEMGLGRMEIKSYQFPSVPEARVMDFLRARAYLLIF